MYNKKRSYNHLYLQMMGWMSRCLYIQEKHKESCNIAAYLLHLVLVEFMINFIIT